MLREKAKLFSRALALFDMATVVVAYLCTLYVLPSQNGIRTLPVSSTLLLFAAPGFYTALYALGAYRSFRLGAIASEAGLIAKAVAATGAGLLVVLWLTHDPQPMRSALTLFLAVTFLLVFLGRTGLRTGLRMVRSRGYNLRYYLVVGTGERARVMVEELESQANWGIRIIGQVAAYANQDGFVPRERLLGTMAELERLLTQQVIDGVFFAIEELSQPVLRQGLECCRRLGIRAFVDLHLFEEPSGYLTLANFSQSPLLVIGETLLDEQHAFFKRLFDLGTALFALVVTAPLMVAIAALVKASTPGPVLFRQERVGMNGRQFTIVKFRTMVAGAEELRATVAARNEMHGPVFKIRNDPRLTPIGRYLRQASLDELPQLWNVLRGEMSMVGPRPPLPHEVAQYQSWQRRRLSVRPGLTCLWQVSGRNQLDFDAWMKLDLEYIDNWSWWLDLKILARTLPAMVRGE
jgi:exopolysaccharide biosynthesis polyprenyl glycosylphosphotransferase